MSAALTKLRQSGFVVRLIGDKLGISPAERLSDTQLQWLKANRLIVLDALRCEQAANQEIAVMRHCLDCAHDVRSMHNPEGGLTYCKIRSAVPMMVPGTRRINCTQYSPIAAE